MHKYSIYIKFSSIHPHNYLNPFYTNRVDKEEWKKQERWEFIGSISEEMRKKYLYKSVAHYYPPNAQNPVRYTFK